MLIKCEAPLPEPQSAQKAVKCATLSSVGIYSLSHPIVSLEPCQEAQVQMRISPLAWVKVSLNQT